jgi:hypothetical protein
MELDSSQDVGGAGDDCQFLSLPRELRDAIWVIVVTEDVAGISPQRYLTTLNLLLVNRQVRDEITDLFCARDVLYFKSSLNVAILLLYWSLHEDHLAWIVQQPHSRSRTFLKIGNLSILPDRSLSSSRDDSGDWHHIFGTRTNVYCRSADSSGWRYVTLGLDQLLPIIQYRKMGLRSLEIIATLLLNASTVRLLRRLRGVDLHAAFIPEPTLPLKESTRLPQQREWLGETGDTDIVLPIYESPNATEPIAVAPFARFVAAIRREVASATPLPIGVSNVQKNTPLWIEFDSHEAAANNGLSPPSSGWYRYVSRDPGVCCLECASVPEPSPPQRKQLRRRRRDIAKLSAALKGCTYLCFVAWDWRVHRARAKFIRRTNVQGVVIKAEAVLKKLPGFSGYIEGSGPP